MKDITLPWVNAGNRLPVEGLINEQCRTRVLHEPIIFIRESDENGQFAGTCEFKSLHDKPVYFSLHNVEWLDLSPEAIASMLLEVRREAFEAARENTTYLDESDYKYENFEDWINQK